MPSASSLTTAVSNLSNSASSVLTFSSSSLSTICRTSVLGSEIAYLPEPDGTALR